MVAATWSCGFGPNASYVRAPALPLTGARSTAARIAAFSSELPHLIVYMKMTVAVVLDELVRKVAVPRDAAVDALMSDLQQHGAGVGGAFDHDALSFRRVAS